MLIALIRHKAELLIVGGYAVVLHGNVRTNEDLENMVKASMKSLKY